MKKTIFVILGTILLAWLLFLPIILTVIFTPWWLFLYTPAIALVVLVVYLIWEESSGYEGIYFSNNPNEN